VVNKELKYLDLFSGAGGLSEGFMNAGYTPLAHVEVDLNACKTLETRLIYHSLKKKGNLDAYYAYILGNIDRSNFVKKYGENFADTIINISIGEENNKDIFDQIDRHANDVDLIIGGPPPVKHTPWLAALEIRIIWRTTPETFSIKSMRNF